MTSFERICSALAALGLIGGASGAFAETQAESRPLNAFTRIQISTGASAEILCGSPAHVVVSSDSSDGVERTKTDVDDDTLSIRFRGMGSWSGVVKIVVTTPTPLQAFKASSGGSLRVHSCAIAPGTVELWATAGGEILLGGKAQMLDVHVTTGGRIGAYEGEELWAQHADVEASSGGSARLCKVQTLEGHASSGGLVQTGQNARCNLEVSSGGAVSRQDCP